MSLTKVYCKKTLNEKGIPQITWILIIIVIIIWSLLCFTFDSWPTRKNFFDFVDFNFLCHFYVQSFLLYFWRFTSQSPPPPPSGCPPAQCQTSSTPPTTSTTLFLFYTTSTPLFLFYTPSTTLFLFYSTPNTLFLIYTTSAKLFLFYTTPTPWKFIPLLLNT